MNTPLQKMRAGKSQRQNQVVLSYPSHVQYKNVWLYLKLHESMRRNQVLSDGLIPNRGSYLTKGF